MSPEKGKLVYSSGTGRVCGKCGWPASDCHCSSSLGAAADETVPTKLTTKLRLENRASGKNVTVVDGLPRNAAFLASLVKELRKSCGTGGHAGEGAVELQGDQ
ncbi:MAG: stress response translation initiation inhibitor YciH, partial [Thermoanaerobaculia bacterium]